MRVSVNQTRQDESIRQVDLDELGASRALDLRCFDEARQHLADHAVFDDHRRIVDRLLPGNSEQLAAAHDGERRAFGSLTQSGRTEDQRNKQCCEQRQTMCQSPHGRRLLL